MKALKRPKNTTFCFSIAITLKYYKNASRKYISFDLHKVQLYLWNNCGRFPYAQPLWRNSVLASGRGENSEMYPLVWQRVWLCRQNCRHFEVILSSARIHDAAREPWIQLGFRLPYPPHNKHHAAKFTSKLKKYSLKRFTWKILSLLMDSARFRITILFLIRLICCHSNA